MADVLTSGGLVLYVSDGTNMYPFACTKTSSLVINRDMIELAPKTNGTFREYLKGRMTYTLTGDGLIKISQSGMHPLPFFDDFITGTDTLYNGRFDMIDPQGNYLKYSFSCYIQNLTLSRTYGSTPSYAFVLQGVGPLVAIP